ncbi:MAG: ribose 5-phosphate isomerase B [Anaerolineales bacterium]|nr:ribose 5-phosphate isomerase B [Anaerolineales bacterium]
MRIAIGADHAGFHLKEAVAGLLRELGHEVHDFGAYNAEPSDYPDFARAVAEAVAQSDFQRGILVCGNGIGVCITANKVPGIRAAVCHDTLSARQSRENLDANVLCLGERIIGVELALEIVRVWLAAEFSGLERYRRRLAKVTELEGK